MVTYSQFVTLVESMRAHQKNYFKTRSISQLTAAKKFECLVDDAIAFYHLEQDRTKPKQLQIFNDDDNNGKN